MQWHKSWSSRPVSLPANRLVLLPSDSRVVYRDRTSVCGAPDIQEQDRQFFSFSVSPALQPGNQFLCRNLPATSVASDQILQLTFTRCDSCSLSFVLFWLETLLAAWTLHACTKAKPAYPSSSHFSLTARR